MFSTFVILMRLQFSSVVHTIYNLFIYKLQERLSVCLVRWISNLTDVLRALPSLTLD